MFIRAKSTDIDEIFKQLIEKHEDLKNINFLLKGVESVTYSFTKIIINWIKKNVQLIHETKDNKCFQYSVIISLYHKDIKKKSRKNIKD